MNKTKLIIVVIFGAIVAAVVDYSLGINITANVGFYASFAHKIIYMLWGGCMFLVIANND